MPDRPNVLIVMTDHQRGDSTAPGSATLTPNIDRVAAEGVNLTRTFCPAPHCCPARATFHSGLYPTQHGVWNNIKNGQRLSDGIGPDVRLWATDLKDAGYDLAFTGKWHVDTKTAPADHGWRDLDERPARHGQTQLAEKHDRSWDKWKEMAEAGQLTREPGEPRPEGVIDRPGYGPFRLYFEHGPGNETDARSTRNALEELPKLAAADDPWAMFVGYTGPHDPYFVPQKFLDMYPLDSIELPPSFADDLSDKPRVYQRLRQQIWGQLSEREYKEAIRHFRAYTTWLDDQFGQILAQLDATGQRENTVVMFCSDHGDYCGDHGLFAKGICAFEGAYHVPMVVRWPAGLGTDARVDNSLVSLADVGPTLLEMAGVEIDREFTGRSFLPLLRGEQPGDWRDAIFGMCDGVELYYSQRWVRTQTHKYVFNGFDFDELYDLENDPHEMTNLAADPAHDGTKRDLVQRMWRFSRDLGDTMINPYITVGLAPWGPGVIFE